MKMPVGFFDQESSGKLLSRITYDSEQVAAATSGSLVSLVREGASIIALMGIMFWNSWQLSAILLVIARLWRSVFAWSPSVFAVFQKYAGRYGLCYLFCEQMLKGHKVVLSYGGQQVEKERFDDVSNRMRQQTMKLVSAQAIANPVIQVIASLALVVV